MQLLDKFEHDRYSPEQIWIPLPDGARLSARLYRPIVNEPVGVVVEWIPYRSSDATAIGDSMMHGWFAGHGLAALRIDIRGSGNSDGALTDEYLVGEQDDAVAAIDWIARQSWCNGCVGLIGISWGGFAALQIAARRPPALKAIITACSTDDRYRDDVHYMGGAMLNDGVSWGAGLFTQVARPPDPAYAGDDWRRLWMERLEGITPPLAFWIAHGTRDAYWRHGSVCEDYGAITCPVFAVGGWTDGYSDAALRMMTHLKVPRRGLIGPWTHLYPNFGMPGPAIDFLGECLTWWRRWLTPDAEPGNPDDVVLDAWIGEGLKANAKLPEIAGNWSRLRAWPPEPAGHRHVLNLGALAGSAAGATITVDSPQDCGQMGGEWCPLDGGGAAAEFQSDQRTDDGLSICFDTPPLDAPLSTLGAPVLSLSMTMATPTTLVAARLCEVTPEEVSSRVTFGLLRLTRPEHVGADTPFVVPMPLKAVGYRFSAGSRIRLALSNAYWPMAWPEAKPSPWKLTPSDSTLSLPVYAGGADPVPQFGAAEAAVPIAHEILAPGTDERHVTHNIETGGSTCLVRFSRATVAISDLTFGGSGQEQYRIDSANPAAAETRIERETWFRRPDWTIEIRTTTHLRREDGHFRLDSTLHALENGETAFRREWAHHFTEDGNAA